mgnify:CR=1 FL=1
MARPLGFAAAAVCAALLLGGCVSIRGGVTHNTVAAVPEGALRHVVLVKFQPAATAADIAAVEAGMAELPARIPEIDAFEWGVEATGRGLNKGFTHGAVFTFDTAEDLQTYLDHPAHKAFVDAHRPVIAELFVFDYIVRR